IIMASRIVSLTTLSILLLIGGAIAADYGTALSKSLLYFEAQRSGKLPPNQRVQWRGDSALKDGGDVGNDLVGGYYDAGDNVKFGFPMAFTVTMLAWSTIEFRANLEARKELANALEAIRWGTDYFIKAHPQADVLYAEVGDGASDHACWERPEDMTTSRTSFRIDDQHPGADVAAETAAAFAAASLAFKGSDPKYSVQLLDHARPLFDFARQHPGQYQSSIPAVGQFYSSSGYQDELSWAAAWLYRATADHSYLQYLYSVGSSSSVRSQFSWDDKYVGVQVLVAKTIFEGKLQESGVWAQYKNQAEQFICSCIQKGNSNVAKTPGGMLWFLPFNNLQYVGAASLVTSIYADYLTAAGRASLQCPKGTATPSDLINLARSQADYVLGSNPKGMSYMVGFGSKYPTQPHHRGASIVSIKKDPTPVGCQQGFDQWFNKNAPNPNVLDGAIVGGPDQNDGYTDARSNFQQAECATVTPASFVGVFARLA
ncbi:hypothetical protein Tsubulata_048060, partial [Turnera subulata]